LSAFSQNHATSAFDLLELFLFVTEWTSTHTLGEVLLIEFLSDSSGGVIPEKAELLHDAVDVDMIALLSHLAERSRGFLALSCWSTAWHEAVGEISAHEVVKREDPDIDLLGFDACVEDFYLCSAVVEFGSQYSVKYSAGHFGSPTTAIQPQVPSK